MFDVGWERLNGICRRTHLFSLYLGKHSSHMYGHLFKNHGSITLSCVDPYVLILQYDTMRYQYTTSQPNIIQCDAI